MNTKKIARVLSVHEAKTRLEELLVAASADPVEIATEGGCTAYLVSKHDFDAMVTAVEALTDQL